MGVHGLSSYIKRLGLLNNNNNNQESTATIPHGSTLAIDGNGLMFHLFRIAYHQHYQTVKSNFASTSSQLHHDDSNNNSTTALLQSQLLLPQFIPLPLLHDVTTTYLSELTTKYQLHLQIYLDGPSSNQYMKRHEKESRMERRNEEWENLRLLCVHGTVPDSSSNGSSGGSKYRSSARRQSRQYYRRQFDNDGSDIEDAGGSSNNTTNDTASSSTEEEESSYLNANFPLSPLIFRQIEQSMHAFANIMSTVLPYGCSVRIIQCKSEADVKVALASSLNCMTTYALGNDTDYLIYGKDENDNNDDDGDNSEEKGGYGDVRYIPFNQIIDPSSSANNNNDDELNVGAILTRSNVSSAMGLPTPNAMIDLSILLGNDYTGPFMRHTSGKKRNYYWESVKWINMGEKFGYGSDENEVRLPPDNELSSSDIQGIAEHVADMVIGWKLASDDAELQSAIDFSYALYTFENVDRFQPPPDENHEESSSDNDDDPDEEIVASPSLPRGFSITLTDHPDPCSAALLSLTTYMSEVAPETKEMPYLEPRHLDAFLMALDKMRKKQKESRDNDIMEPPRHQLQWKDLQALHVMVKCLLFGMRDVQKMPCEVFSFSLFHSCLESLSFGDEPLDNELVSKNEREFREEVTSEFPAAKDSKKKQKEQPVEKLVLPIDEYKDHILNTIKTQRVTIIHGETGCGKSSRVPCFLLRAPPPEPTRTASEVRMIVSQPRRIAAKALAERVRSCEPDLADKIGLRMGHGIREYETHNTRAWFVTTGYVVRLLANHPSWFNSHTHLIIDEVHERSIDTDILCLLCRRLLQSHPTIRLVLMSATMAAELYSQYFGTPEPPIHVGARRFPIKEFFVEDLSSRLSLSAKAAKNARDIFNECEKQKCNSPPSAANMGKLYEIASQITASVGTHGSSVLIFVPGMSDIEAIIELVENLIVKGNTFICLPIHGDVPFEEQMAAFEPPGEGEVKVIIATNAAESSLTLPDVDHVICLGLCKQIVYNKASHRQMLVPTWISKASATQRAGRTGRVREGNVYRLYSRNALHRYMQPFESGELVRSPLDNTILSLRDMLDEEVTPILLECLEPPDISNIERSFKSLHSSNFISDPSDLGDITSLGSLVVALGVDLTLGAFVGLGIQFGVAAEAIEMAAILSFPKTPWAISSPMYHDAVTYNEIMSKTFTSRCFFDAGLFSEPMGVSNMLYDYSNSKDSNQFCWKHRVSGTRMRHLYGTVKSLKQRVAERLSISTAALEPENPPYLMPETKVNILRILQVWLFHDTMIIQNPAKNKLDLSSDGSISIPLDGPPISDKHLQQILDPDLHPYKLLKEGKVTLQGSFDSILANLEDFETRFVSYVLDKGIDFAYYLMGSSIKIFVPSEVWDAAPSTTEPSTKPMGILPSMSILPPMNAAKSTLKDTIIRSMSSVKTKELFYVQTNGGGNQRGRRGRSCGAFYPSIGGPDDEAMRAYAVSGELSKSQLRLFKTTVVEHDIAGLVKSILSCNIKETKNNTLFTMTSSGECHQVTKIDLCDLFAAPDLVASTSTSTMRQTINFTCVEKDDSDDGPSSIDHPLIEDAPEGGRLMSVLASDRRKDNFIRFSDGSMDESIDVNLSKKFAINGRWKRVSGGGMCFVPVNSIPSAVIPTKKKKHDIYGCCANVLDLRGGACRVEGITLLPPGRIFVGLAQLAWGINPKNSLPLEVNEIHGYIEEEKKDDGSGLGLASLNNVFEDIWSWMKEKEKFCLGVHPDKWRVKEALNFHSICMELGESLEIQPDKIKQLCELFNGICPMPLWDGYDVSLTSRNASVRTKPVTKARVFERNRSNISKIGKEAGNQLAAANPKKNRRRPPKKVREDSPATPSPSQIPTNTKSSSRPATKSKGKKGKSSFQSRGERKKIREAKAKETSKASTSGVDLSSYV